MQIFEYIKNAVKIAKKFANEIKTLFNIIKFKCPGDLLLNPEYQSIDDKNTMDELTGEITRYICDNKNLKKETLDSMINKFILIKVVVQFCSHELKSHFIFDHCLVSIRCADAGLCPANVLRGGTNAAAISEDQMLKKCCNFRKPKNELNA